MVPNRQSATEARADFTQAAKLVMNCSLATPAPFSSPQSLGGASFCTSDTGWVGSTFSDRCQPAGAAAVGFSADDDGHARAADAALGDVDDGAGGAAQVGLAPPTGFQDWEFEGGSGWLPGGSGGGSTSSAGGAAVPSSGSSPTGNSGDIGDIRNIRGASRRSGENKAELPEGVKGLTF